MVDFVFVKTALSSRPFPLASGDVTNIIVTKRQAFIPNSTYPAAFPPPAPAFPGTSAVDVEAIVVVAALLRAQAH